MQTVKTTCPYCGVGCGLNVAIKPGTVSESLVLGDEDHPANLGRLCSKGSVLAETLDASLKTKRLNQPLVEGKEVSWSDATQAIADKINASIKHYGRDSVAFYLSGQLLTEDYYVANKLMKGFIGTANVDTNSRLCMSSAVAAYKRAFGSDTVPCSYEDIDAAELIVLIGSNAAWTHPVLYQRMVVAKENNPNLKIVLIDPRKTASCEIADLHLAIQPSSDAFLFQGLLKYLIDSDVVDHAYIGKNTDGFDEASHSVAHRDLASVAQHIDVDPVDLEKFFQWFSQSKKALSFYSQGINQSATGTDKCNAIINCHLATGKIGYSGAGPFSITGQPNAMGGREVGGLANMLAAHMDFNQVDCDRVQRFWNSPRIAMKAGLKAVDLFDAVADGRIKVLWILATNPAVSLPKSNKVRAALARCPTVIVSDVTHTDTTAFADILLPAQAWSEKDGTVTNSERRISRQRAFKEPPINARPDWWALTKVAKKLGYVQHFDYQSAHQVFIEHSRLSGFENDNSRAFDISGLSTLDASHYDSLSPIQWPINLANPNGCKRMFGDANFYTDTKRAKFVSGRARLATDLQQPNVVGGLLLNTGRLRDQWHTMTRTGSAPSLTGHDDIPFVLINPIDAKERQLVDAELVKISNDNGEFIAALKFSDDIKLGGLFSPIHWNDQFAKQAVVTSVISSMVDPVSGQPELKASRVNVTQFGCLNWVRVASKQQLDKNSFDYWAETKTKRGYISLIGSNKRIDWRHWGESLVTEKATFIQYSDQISDTSVIIASHENSLELLIFESDSVTRLPSFAWQSAAFDDNNMQTLSTLLRSEEGDRDSLVCSCFKTTQKAIDRSISSGAQDLNALGSVLGCGSKCGSCKPELSKILRQSSIV